MGIVYCATNILNGKSYIGKTVKPLQKRVIEHISQGKKDHLKFHNALRKYGKEGFVWGTLFESDSEKELLEREQFWIKAYNTMEEGYNLTLGGEGVMGHKHSDEVKKILSQKKIGTAFHRGFIHSEESKEKNRKAHIGKQIGALNHKARKIICIETQEIFDCISDATKAKGLSRTSINAVLSGRSKTSGKLHWQYAN